MKNKIWSSKEKQTLLFMAAGILISAIAVCHQHHIVQENTNPVISIAKEHLQKYVHNAFPDVDFFSTVKKVEVVEGECEKNHYWENFGKEKFCGWSTYAKCKTDADCETGGCSGQVCEGKGEGTITTCEMRDCYNRQGYKCKCIDGKCQWSLLKQQCWIIKFYYHLPEGYLAVYVDKNTNNVIGGTQTRQ
ncbi:MAG: hypothetical protein DRP18_03150 [Candidatus Aenigmatarchaeota archaeon]|nr:MAG: hypothetical protein DRP18_03150 [Candidatus Aenigmarchaeota archaeon]RLJ07279.1 MAG: hypothetical protein DRP16_03755 [Candidatus Aenigmarchaeota archaeon]